MCLLLSDCEVKPEMQYISGCTRGIWRDLTTDAECVANLVNVTVCLWTCISTVYSTGMLYLHNDLFLKPHLHDTTGCQTGCTTGLTMGLTTRCVVYTNVYPVVKPVWHPVWQQVVSCKRGFTDIVGCDWLKFSLIYTPKMKSSVGHWWLCHHSFTLCISDCFGVFCHSVLCPQTL